MKKKIIYALTMMLILLLTIGTMSCTPKTNVFVQPTGNVVVTIDIASSEVMDSIVANFANFSEEEKKENASIFETEQIKKELEKQGLKVFYVKANSMAGIQAKFKVFQKHMQGENSFVKTDMKKGLLSLSIGPKNIQEFVNMLSAEDREMLDMLMAPVFTGEDLSEAEYIENMAAFGPTLANELKRSKMKISVTCPKKVRSIEIKPFGKGVKKGNKAFIEIPLTRILCVKKPIFAEVKFRP